MKSSTYLKLGSIILALSLLFGCNGNENKLEENVHEDYSIMENQSAAIEEEFEKKNENLQRQFELLESKLSSQIKELEYELMITNKAIRSFPSAWPYAQSFIEAYFALDLDAIQEMISDKYTVHDESISYANDYEGRIHMPHLALNGEIESYNLNSFGYDPMQSNTLFFIQMMYKGEMGTGFINLHMERKDTEWIVEKIEFDI